MLVHFLWQGTLIAVLLAAVRGVAGRRIAPRARYAMACLALGLMTITRWPRSWRRAVRAPAPCLRRSGEHPAARLGNGSCRGWWWRGCVEQADPQTTRVPRPAPLDWR